jgi:hypothetical protein
MPMRTRLPWTWSTVIVILQPTWIISPGFLLKTSIGVVLREYSNKKADVAEYKHVSRHVGLPFI